MMDKNENIDHLKLHGEFVKEDKETNQRRGMDADEFRKRGKEMVDYVADYLENIEQRNVFPTVKPGYMKSMIPENAPNEPEQWEKIMQDVEKIIMPGVTHWHHPHFHAYFPTANSFPAICGNMLSDAIGCIGFTWASSPACTELEMAMMDWLGQMLQLPDHFMFSSGGNGGGIIQGTASEATLVAMFGARNRTIQNVKESNPEMEDSSILSSMVGYCSDQAHCSVERAGLLSMINIRHVKSDAKFQMRGESLRAAIAKDKAEGKRPIFVCATLGTTNSCAFDNLLEIGPICQEEGIWLHIDAAYAGSAFICPEFRPLLDGVEFADSFNFNPHKWMLVNFDCSAMWIKNSAEVIDAFSVDPLYLKHQYQGTIPDYRHWQIPLGRRFRSLKLWFVLRLHGVLGLQEYIRKHIRLAKEFEKLVAADEQFEVVNDVRMGLVCFRKKATNEDNERLLHKINTDGRIHLVPSQIGDMYFIRFAVCYSRAEIEHINYAWDVIRDIGRES